MAYYDDLSPCTYFGADFAKQLVAVGWLDQEHPFTQGSIESTFLEKLLLSLVHPWQPYTFQGWHDCPFCRISKGPRYITWQGNKIEMGIDNLFIPGDKVIYVAPSLIVHYIDAHGYTPPQIFQQYTLQSPEMRSVAYLRAIINNGPKGFTQRK